jgi:hypothetical protein
MTLTQGQPMMKLCLLVLTTGCLAAAGDDTVDQLDQEVGQTIPWHAVLRCGGDGVVVDVDLAERRDVQVVVRNPAAVAWLSSHPGDGGTGMANAKHEIILRAMTIHGVFAPADFSVLVVRGYFSNDSFTPAAYAGREGTGLRVRLVSWASGHEVETANWWFADCH